MANLSIIIIPFFTVRETLFSSTTEEDVDDFNPLVTIHLFVKYVGHLILIALEVRVCMYASLVARR